MCSSRLCCLWRELQPVAVHFLKIYVVFEVQLIGETIAQAVIQLWCALYNELVQRGKCKARHSHCFVVWKMQVEGSEKYMTAILARKKVTKVDLEYRWTMLSMQSRRSGRKRDDALWWWKRGVFDKWNYKRDAMKSARSHSYRKEKGTGWLGVSMNDNKHTPSFSLREMEW